MYVSDYFIFLLTDSVESRFASIIFFVVLTPDFFFADRISFPFSRTDQAFFSKSNQILPACLKQSFPDQIMVFGVFVLDQGPLHIFFMGISAHINLIPRYGIYSRIVHDGGKGGRRRIKILYLFRHVA